MSEQLPPNKTRKQIIWENVVSLAVALFVVLIIRSSIVEAFRIPSGSMIPTLLVGDHIFVNKFAYGFKLPFSDLKIPFTDMGLEKPIILIGRDGPKHGDIIVFEYPRDPSLYYIKRVVGTAGDVIEIKNKVLTINGKLISQSPAEQPMTDKVFQQLEDDPKYSKEYLDVLREKLADDATSPGHLMMLDKNSLLDESRGPITVPADSLFVMGDNRDYSNDSRFWGFVPLKNVKGRAMVIWLSMWISFSDSQFVFRPTRSGTILH